MIDVMLILYLSDSRTMIEIWRAGYWNQLEDLYHIYTDLNTCIIFILAKYGRGRRQIQNLSYPPYRNVARHRPTNIQVVSTSYRYSIYTLS